MAMAAVPAAAAALPTAASFAQYLPAIISAIASGAGGLFSGNETSTQANQRQLIDELMSSLKGDGPYSDLFNVDDDAFQKSYIDPAKARFRNQIAPQIQEQYIASGQHRGTSMEDTLTRAGVDLDQMLNEQYMNFQQSGQRNQMDAMSKILGAGTGSQGPQSGFDKFSQGIGGYLTSPSFNKSIDQILNKRPQSAQKGLSSPREGFTNG